MEIRLRDTRFVKVLSIMLVVAMACFALYAMYRADMRIQLDQRVRENQSLAVRSLPDRSTGPIQVAEAEAALRALNIQANAAAVAVAYQQEGQSGFGCVVTARNATGATPEETSRPTVAEACREAGGLYLKDLAEVEEFAAQPSFYNTPFLRSARLARLALPEGSMVGNAAEVLPLLERAEFDESDKVAIVSYRSAYDAKPGLGCVLVGEMGVFKASGASETAACATVISMAKAAVAKA
jgi:hypothetical protein